MDNLEDIKRSADAWYDSILVEVDKAVQKAFEEAAAPPSQQDHLPQ